MKKIVAVLLAVAFLIAGAGDARASHADVYGEYPDAMHIENPYARPLQQARAALERSIQQFWAVYYRQPYDYWAVVDAYYAYVNAYYTYRWYLDAYWRWQKERRSFAGRVMTDNSQPGVVYIRAPIDPVPGAKVTLTNVVPPGSLMPVRIFGTQFTDSSGNFEFKGLAEGKYAYSVDKDGFLPESGVVEVSTGRLEKTIFIKKVRRLTGTVVTPQLFGTPPPNYHPDRFPPRPVAGARVTLTYLNASGYVAAMVPMRTTDAHGRFEFENIPCTSVRVTVEANHYRRHEQTVNLARSHEDVRIVIFSTLPPPPIAVPVNAAESTTSSNELNNPFGQ